MNKGRLYYTRKELFDTDRKRSCLAPHTSRFISGSQRLGSARWILTGPAYKLSSTRYVGCHMSSPKSISAKFQAKHVRALARPSDVQQRLEGTLGVPVVEPSVPFPKISWKHLTTRKLLHASATFHTGRNSKLKSRPERFVHGWFQKMELDRTCCSCSGLTYSKYLFKAEPHAPRRQKTARPVRSATDMFRAAQRGRWQVVMQDTRGNHEI